MYFHLHGRAVLRILTKPKAKDETFLQTWDKCLNFNNEKTCLSKPYKQRSFNHTFFSNYYVEVLYAVAGNPPTWGAWSRRWRSPCSGGRSWPPSAPRRRRPASPSRARPWRSAPSPASAPRSTAPTHTRISAANRLIGEVVQSRRRPLLGPSPGWRLIALSHLRHY